MFDESIRGADDLAPEHILALADAYSKVLDAMGHSPAPYPDITERCGGKIRGGAKYDCLNHAYWMCGRIKRFVEANRRAKALRWIGTVQGFLIMAGVFSIEEIMRQDAQAPDARTIASYLRR